MPEIVAGFVSSDDDEEGAEDSSDQENNDDGDTEDLTDEDTTEDEDDIEMDNDAGPAQNPPEEPLDTDAEMTLEVDRMEVSSKRRDAMEPILGPTKCMQPPAITRMTRAGVR